MPKYRTVLSNAYSTSIASPALNSKVLRCAWTCRHPALRRAAQTILSTTENRKRIRWSELWRRSAHGTSSPMSALSLVTQLSNYMTELTEDIHRAEAAGACDPPLSRSSIGLCQIIHNLVDDCLIDWRTVNLDHLGHLGSPEDFLKFRTPGLGLDIVDRMASRAVVPHDLHVGARLECRRLIRKLVRDRLGVRFGWT